MEDTYDNEDEAPEVATDVDAATLDQTWTTLPLCLASTVQIIDELRRRAATGFVFAAFDVNNVKAAVNPVSICYTPEWSADQAIKFMREGVEYLQHLQQEGKIL